MDKVLNYLSLARKAGLAQLGEEPVSVATQTGKAVLVVVASDAGDHTWRKAKSLVSGTRQQLVRLPYTKDEMGFAIGRTSLAIAAVTDVGIAKALVEALSQPENAAVLEELSRQAEKANARAKTKGKSQKKN